MKALRKTRIVLLILLALFVAAEAAWAQTLSLDKTAYISGEGITATFSSGPGNAHDWVGIYPQGIVPGSQSSTAWLYIDGTCNGANGAANGATTFNTGQTCGLEWPLSPGTYDAYFLENNGYVILDGPVSYTVTASAGATFILDKAVYYEGETITATFTGAPGNATDWVGYYSHPNGGSPTNCSSNGASLGFNFTDGSVDGSVSLYTPIALAGEHVAHFLANNGWCDIAPPQTYTVIESPVGDLSGTGGGLKVIFIGMDGVRPDALALASTPNIDNLIANGAFDENAQTDSATFSGPGWSDIMTGVDENKHGVDSNTYTNSFNYENWPSWLDILEAEDPSLNTVSVVSWDLMNSAISHRIDRRVMHNGYDLGYDVADENVKNSAVSILANEDPDAMFVYFGETDTAGHAYGTLASETIYEIEVVDSHVGQIMNAIQNRSTFGSEDWLILLGTDHGRTDGGSHGGTSANEQWIFYLASGTGSDQGTLVSGASNVTHGATALKHLLGAIDPGWNLDGQPLGLATGGGGGGGIRYVRLVADSEVNGNVWTSVAELNVLENGAPISQSGWSLVSVDSEERVVEDGAATNAFDGDSGSFWHTQWQASTPGPPHTITIDLGAGYDVNGFRYIPRQSGVNGRIADYQFFVSADGVDFGAAAASGTFPNAAGEQEVLFDIVAVPAMGKLGLLVLTLGLGGLCSPENLRTHSSGRGHGSPPSA